MRLEDNNNTPIIDKHPTKIGSGYVKLMFTRLGSWLAEISGPSYAYGPPIIMQKVGYLNNRRPVMQPEKVPNCEEQKIYRIFELEVDLEFARS